MPAGDHVGHENVVGSLPVDYSPRSIVNHRYSQHSNGRSNTCDLSGHAPSPELELLAPDAARSHCGRSCRPRIDCAIERKQGPGDPTTFSWPLHEGFAAVASGTRHSRRGSRQ
jgi:hypothetical protein